MLCNPLSQALIDSMQACYASAANKMEFVDAVRCLVATMSTQRDQPVDHVRWVPVDWVTPNDYNPNAVANQEMSLLLTSILNDGYTQPVVTVWNPATKKYEIVDGFHRYFLCKSNDKVRERNNGLLPIVVLDKDTNDRMASTVRHNRARGKHSVVGMASLVYSMLDGGWEDAQVCNELGMEAEELVRLKHITGFSKLFENAEYRRCWTTRQQERIKRKHLANDAS